MGIKVKNLYNIDSIVRAVETSKTFVGDAGIVLPRELEHISTTIYEQQFANLSFLSMSGITVNNEGGVAETITKIKKSINGDFADAGNDSNTDGKISLSAQSDTIPVNMKKANSSWSEIEVQQAQLAGRNLTGDLLGAHNTRYNQQIDSRGYTGDGAEYDGLLNWSGFATTPATGVFSGLTPQQKYDDIKGLLDLQRAGVNLDPTFGASKIVLSPATYLSLNVILNTAAGPMSVRQALEMNENVTFVITFRATALGVMVAYSADPLAMVMRIPTPLQISNIWQTGFDSNVDSLFRVGGLDVIENQSGYILTGVE